MSVIKLWPSRQSKQQLSEQQPSDQPPSPHLQFEILLQPHLQRLYQLAYRFTGQRADAEDLVQDVVIKLYPRLQEMQKIEKLSPWLARVLYRHFIDRTRSKQRSPVHLVGDDETTPDDYRSGATGPADNTEESILQGHLLRALERLNDDQRALVILHDVEGYTLNEIHTMHDVSLGTLKSRLNRARSRLRELLKNVEPFGDNKRVS
jgi:RNA polymerase sigma-70 factor (ECF subfamily)